MNNNYDNKFSNTIVLLIGTLVRTVERSLVLFFDGLRNAVEHGNPSLFGLIATLLPILLPAPVAYMTAISLMHFFEWDTWAAAIMGAGIEGLGLVVWVVLVHIIQDDRRNTAMLYFFGGAATAYELILIVLNVVLAAQEGKSGPYISVLFLICLLPALSAITYGYRNHLANERLERERQEAKDEAERLRQERRQDRKEAQALKMQYAKDLPSVKLTEADRKNGGKFRS
jgi:hypothetical protein